MQVILLHIYKMVPDQKLHRLDVVLVFVTAFNQTPANMKQVRDTKFNRFMENVTIAFRMVQDIPFCTKTVPT